MTMGYILVGQIDQSKCYNTDFSIIKYSLESLESENYSCMKMKKRIHWDLIHDGNDHLHLRGSSEEPEIPTDVLRGDAMGAEAVKAESAEHAVSPKQLLKGRCYGRYF